ncbi:MAG: histidine kinase [Candidatus Eisenbacteria bacterium]
MLPLVRPEVFARRVLAVTAVCIAIGIALPRFLTHTPYQRLGAGVARGGVVDRVVGPPAKGLLQVGDRLMSVNGISLRDSVARHAMRARGWPRGPIDLTFERNGIERTVQLPPVHLSAWERLRIYTYPIAAVIAAPLVAFLLVWRRPDLSTAWVFLWFAALEGLGVIWNLYQFAQGDQSAAMRVYLKCYEWLAWLYPASFVHFMSVFPRPRWTKGRRVRSPWYWLTVVAYLVPLAVFLNTRGWTLGPASTAPDYLYNWYQALAFTVGIISLVERYSRSGPDWNPTASQRALAVLVGFALLVGGVLNVVAGDPRVQTLLPQATLQVLFTGILVAWLTTPFIIAYLIADDPLFDPRRLIVGGLPYALLSGVLAAIYLGVVLVGQRVFASVTGEQTLVFNVVAALVLAFTFAPLRENVQRNINRIYGRDPQALRAALDATGRDLLSALDRDEVRNAVAGGIERGLRRRVAIVWPGAMPPHLADPEEVPEHARGAVESLLAQAGVRLENLRLAAERAAAERAAVEMREAATVAELRALQAQVQPHFLFNALNALAYLIETDVLAAQRFTGRLADMLRYTVEAGKRPVALLSDELAFVEDYLGVARERYENPLHFRFKGDPGLLSSSVPPLLLQPLVENSVKHGVASAGASLRMTLDAKHHDGWLELDFTDDGCPNDHQRPGLGVGLENLEQRVRRFAGPQASVYSGRRENGGFVVSMRWPVSSGGST